MKNLMENEQGFEKLKKSLGAMRAIELFEFHSAIDLGEELVKYKPTITKSSWRKTLKELDLSFMQAEFLMDMYVYRDILKTELKPEELRLENVVKAMLKHKRQLYANRIASLPREDLKDKHKSIDLDIELN